MKELYENWDTYKIRAESPGLRINIERNINIMAGMQRSNLYPYLLKKQQEEERKKHVISDDIKIERNEIMIPKEIEGVTMDDDILSDDTMPVVQSVDTATISDDAIMTDDDTTSNLAVEDIINTSKGGITYGVIGTGQGGGRIAFEGFYLNGIKKCICINSAKQDLDALEYNDIKFPENQKVYCLLDKDGAGKDIKKGKEAILKFSQDIINKMKQILGQVDNIIICVGGSGGTGTGSMMVLYDLAVRYLDMIGISNPQNHVGVFVTLPKRGELSGNPVIKDNTKVIFSNIKELISKKASPIVVADNDKIDIKFGKKLTPRNYWPKINSSLAGTFIKINELTLNKGITPFDPTDYSQVITRSGCFVIGASDISMEQFEKSSTAISDVLAEKIRNSLLANFDISKAKVAGLVAVLGDDAMNTPGAIEKVESGFNTFKAAIGNEITIFPSIYESKKQKGIRVYALVGGLGLPIHSLVK